MLENKELLKAVAEEGKKTFISTGMSTWKELDEVVAIFEDASCPFELMHCNSTYPMKEEDANLLLIDELKKRYGVPVGYSGHEEGILVSIVAATCGISSIERHITLNRNMYGSDQKASIDFEQLGDLVESVRKMDAILGDGIRKMSEAELTVRKKLREN